MPTHLIAAFTSVVPTLYIMMDGTGVPCVKRDTRRHKGRDGKRAKTRGILLRNGGQGLVTHLERFYAKTAAGNKEAKKELDYFKKRISHMKYAEYRKANLYIGSGIVEAACRTDVTRRCKQAGMHWRLHNATAMCALTARLRSGVPAAKSAA